MLKMPSKKLLELINESDKLIGDKINRKNEQLFLGNK